MAIKVVSKQDDNGPQTDKMTCAYGLYQLSTSRTDIKDSNSVESGHTDKHELYVWLWLQRHASQSLEAPGPGHTNAWKCLCRQWLGTEGI